MILANEEAKMLANNFFVLFIRNQPFLEKEKRYLKLFLYAYKVKELSLF